MRAAGTSAVKLQIEFLKNSLAGEINIYKVINDQGHLDEITNMSSHSLDGLRYNPNTGMITLYVKGQSQGTTDKWAEVEQNGKPTALITAKLLVNGTNISTDAVKYLVVSPSHFLYRLFYPWTSQNIPPYYLPSQDLRCLLAAKGVYKQKDLQQFCLRRLVRAEIEDLGLGAVAGDLASPNPTTGFKAALYRDFISQKYILAFAGTDTDNREDIRKDFIENYWQARGNFNNTPQYQKAVEIAEVVMSQQNKLVNCSWAGPEQPFQCIFTGHSLGGGLASAASVASGLLAITFNAAGLHPAAVNIMKHRQEAQARFNNNGSDLVKAYFVDYDILTMIQRTFSAEIPVAIGTPIKLDSDQDINAAAAVSLLIAGRKLPKYPPFVFPKLAAVLGGSSVLGYAGYKCHGSDRLLYGFLVKEGTFSNIENLLKEPPIFPL